MNISTENLIKHLRSDNGIKFAVVAGILLIMPFVSSIRLANEILVFAIFALGYNVILGYGGELSFGHSVYFGIGAYGTVLAIGHLTSNLYVAVLVGVIAATTIGLVFGYISLQRRGIYFAMITLALAMMVYFIVLKWTEFTGGSSGISIPPMDASIGPVDPTQGGVEFYVFGLILLVVVWSVLWRLLGSSYGRALISIRENEERARHLGYDVNKYLVVAFAISALISGFAGALFATAFAFITPSILYWSVSGEIVLTTLMGGVGTLGGPIVGAALFIFVQDAAVSYTEHWELIFGSIVILFVLFAPEGVYGKFKAHLEGEAQLFDADDLRERFG